MTAKQSWRIRVHKQVDYMLAEGGQLLRLRRAGTLLITGDGKQTMCSNLLLWKRKINKMADGEYEKQFTKVNDQITKWYFQSYMQL